MSFYHYTIKVLLVFAFVNFISSCNKFLEADVAKSQITKDVVFSSDATATAAVTGIYSTMYGGTSNFASGSIVSVTGLCGLSADELNYCPNNPEMKSFEAHSLMPPNVNLQALWSSMYFTIYEANSAIEGLNTSSSLTPSVKDQLLGECLFIRAFAHFYLVNLFDAVPIVLSTDYRSNAKLSRMEPSLVYEQIVNDLLGSLKIIGDNYPGAERTRPNKAAVTSFLSRVYLYMGNWEEAELEATKIIEDGMYSFTSNLDMVFLKNSGEAIWQLRPPSNQYRGTNEATCFVLTYSPFLNPASPCIVTPGLLNAFEANDSRKSTWINTFDDGTDIFHYPFKYKDKNPNQSEYSMVLRRSELFLIRSEARAKLDNLSGAMADLDSIRNHAGIPLISTTNPGISKEDLLLAIEKERRVELFTEWGHRWLDLKRTGRADIVLQSKAGYKPTAKLYPIPQLEFNKNPSLGDQNEGY